MKPLVALQVHVHVDHPTTKTSWIYGNLCFLHLRRTGIENDFITGAYVYL